MVLTPASENTSLPESVDNSGKIWMRDIFNQGGDNSCAQSAAVGYTFTYEINRLRNLSSNTNQNLYPVDFTYNFLNEGNNGGSWDTHGYIILKQTGCPNIDTYEPGGDGFVEGTKWMHGYENYFSGTANRAEDFKSINVWSHLDTLKHWINDHAIGDESGGLATFTANTSYSKIETEQIPPDSEEGAGLWIVNDWGDTEDGHTMTIVGYNDNIMYPVNDDDEYRNDYDNNGDQVIDMRDWEIGAVKVANSWGPGWNNSNGGYVYVPYRLLADLIYSYNNSLVFVIDAIEAYEPEIILKAKVDHNRRNKLKFYMAFAENADISYPLAQNQKSLFAFNRNGGQYPMQGDNNFDPLETALDFSYRFANEDVGKVFFQVHQIETTNGTINSFSLIDYRWDEILEVPCEQSGVQTQEGFTTLSINYDVLPFFFNPLDGTNRTISSDAVVRKQTVVKAGVTLNIDSGTKIDFYNSELVIEEGATLNVGQFVAFRDKTGGSKLTIRGDVNFSSNTNFICDGESPFTVLFDNSTDVIYLTQGVLDNTELYSYADEINFNSCTVTDSYIEQKLGDINLIGSTFENSSVSALNYSMQMFYDYAITVDDCSFDSHYANKNSILTIHQFKNFDIFESDFEISGNVQYALQHGISVSLSGNSERNNRQHIYDNDIFRKSGTYNNTIGISCYSTKAEVQDNYIYDNYVGIQCMNYSLVDIEGTCDDVFNESQTQRIKNNTLNQIFASTYAFPSPLQWNAIYEDTYSTCFIMHDVNMNENPPDVYARNNYWGPGLSTPPHDPINNLCPVNHYQYSIWNLDGCGESKSQPAALTLYETAEEQIADSNYSEAKATFQEVVTEYPESEYAKYALNEILFLETLADNDFNSLKNWFLTEDEIQENETLLKLAESLANKCDEYLDNYIDAIEWYENMIEDPPTLEDSVFAIIDLGNFYLELGIDTSLKSSTYVGRFSQYKPVSCQAYEKHKIELLGLLLGHKNNGNNNEPTNEYVKIEQNQLLQNNPNPFSNKTMINFHLNSKIIGSVEIRIYNHVGKQVKPLVVDQTTKGQNAIELNMGDMPSGIYYYSLFVNGKQADTKKMVVVK